MLTPKVDATSTSSLAFAEISRTARWFGADGR